jgi:FemAB-related protein (PEP-CTERM system-associated)
VTVTVERFAGAAQDWDACVRRSPGWTHFHLYGWRAIIRRTYGHDCVYLAARDADGSLSGVLPLVHVRSVVFGRYLVSMPFVSYGGPLGSEEAVGALGGAALEEARRARVKLLELRSRRELPLDMDVSHRKITVLLDVPADSEALWNGLPAKLRSQVRRPQKEGIDVRFGRDQLEPFFGVFARHMRDLGTPVQPRRLFEAIADVFGADIWFACAYHKDQAIAAGCGLRWGEEFEITWAAALREFNAVSPNMLVYWRMLEQCAKSGIRVFNFGRCSPGSGTHRFKKQWGGRDEPLWWYQWSGAASAAAATPSPDDPAYAWGPRIWRRLPLALANLLGPRVVRYIP